MGTILYTPYLGVLLHLKFGGIGYCISQKCWPNRVLVSDLNQKNGFGRLLYQRLSAPRIYKGRIDGDSYYTM